MCCSFLRWFCVVIYCSRTADGIMVSTMETNKQTAMVAIQVPLDPFGATIITSASAKYYYSPAFIFFVVANAMACGYTVLSLIPGRRLAFKSGVYSLKPAFLVAVADLVMVALVSSGASAAAAIAYVGYKGNSHTQWLKICDNFGRFCHHTAAAIVTSFVGVIIFMILTVMSIYGIYKHSSRAR